MLTGLLVAGVLFLQNVLVLAAGAFMWWFVGFAFALGTNDGENANGFIGVEGVRAHNSLHVILAQAVACNLQLEYAMFLCRSCYVDSRRVNVLTT